MIIIIGRTGVGKSSLFEDITGPKGHAQQNTDSVTEKCVIGKTSLNNKEYYVMDTPGFSPGNEKQVFLEIIRGIQATHCADVVGILYVTCVNQPRFDEFDRKLVRFVDGLCGKNFFSGLTFVTTFWTAPGEKQRASLEKQLALLQATWKSECGEQGHKLYQHGRQYEGERDTGRCLDWFEQRGDIAKHAEDILSLFYNSGQEGSNFYHPLIIQELDAGITPLNTTAGKLIMPCVVEDENTNTTNQGMPAGEERSDSTTDTAPESSHTAPATETQAASQTQKPIDWWFLTVKGLQGIEYVLKSDVFNAFLGGNSGASTNAYRGPLGKSASDLRDAIHQY
ncbi:unnamed protein product [Clonostachys chloroleuca]|uniref:G domain-containing protein n=1 Tax=Clonostachys chloroleuca TaxID=1926264 RepID=A0AA35MAN2_9HYPO|nr:unnamed protein product [Clonostachys chloroleuca]